MIIYNMKGLSLRSSSRIDLNSLGEGMRMWMVSVLRTSEGKKAKALYALQFDCVCNWCGFFMFAGMQSLNPSIGPQDLHSNLVLHLVWYPWSKLGDSSLVRIG